VQRKTAKNTALLLRYLQKSIEEAVVDCYDKAEQASGFLTVSDENLACHSLCVSSALLTVESDDDGSLGARCERGGERPRIGLTNLPQPSPSPCE